MKIDFTNIKESNITIFFDNNFGVEIYCNFELYILNEIKNIKSDIYRYDVCPLGKDIRNNMIYNLFGFNLMPVDRLTNLSQEQVEDLCDDIANFPKYIVQSKDIASLHLSEYEVIDIINRAIEKIQ